jgi:hypothetical protein
MATQRQRMALAVVIAFGLGVLLTLERVGTDAEERIRAARRLALECHDIGPAEMIAPPQPETGDRT